MLPNKRQKLRVNDHYGIGLYNNNNSQSNDTVTLEEIHSHNEVNAPVNVLPVWNKDPHLTKEILSETMHTKGCSSFHSYTPDRNREFNRDILSRFRKAKGELSKFCCGNKLLIYLERKLYKSISSDPQQVVNERFKVMAFMKVIGKIAIAFIADGHNFNLSLDFEDLFNTKHFFMFRDAILSVALVNGEMHEARTLFIKLALTNCAASLSKLYQINSDTEKSEIMQRFDGVWAIWSKCIFNISSHEIISQVKDKSSQQNNLPLEDVAKVINYINEEVELITQREKDVGLFPADFLILRRLCIAHLRLLNGHRPVDPAELTISDVDAAVKNTWSCHDIVEGIRDVNENILMEKAKVIYVSTNNRVIVPECTIPVLRKLCDRNFRAMANVEPLNKYVFASIDKSLDHSSSWRDTECICSLAGISEKLNTKKERHKGATWFVDEESGHVFYEHLGGSVVENFNLYATKEVKALLTTYGKSLLKMFHIETIYPELFIPLAENDLNKSRRSTKWNDDEHATIMDYFAIFVNDVSQEGTKGPLPGYGDIDAFLELHPEVLPTNQNFKEKRHIIKTKVMNERKKNRDRAFALKKRYKKAY